MKRTGTLEVPRPAEIIRCRPLSMMPVDQVEPKVGAHHPIGEYGQVHLAAVCMAAKRQRNTLWNTPENGGLVRQQDHRRRPATQKGWPSFVTRNASFSRTLIPAERKAWRTPSVPSAGIPGRAPCHQSWLPRTE